ncbi:TPA: glycosyltransferase family 4 protein, partial [Mannheimia haemolytica]|nr:glycosyltransferase family 4 protein [Mannheimia haemolytica]
MNNVKKVLVSGYDLKFWNALQSELEKTGLFEFKQDTLIGNYGHNDHKALELIEWADILVAEWTLNNAVFLSKHKKPYQKLIMRFHAQERLTEYPNQIDYSVVDTIIFVGSHVMDEAINKFNIPAFKCCVVGNYIDVDRFSLPKMGDEYNIGMVGIVPKLKRLDLAFDVLEELLKFNSNYRLHIKGQSPMNYPWLWKRENEKKYYYELFERINSSELRNHIVFDPAGNDVEFWFQKIGYILSPSDFESFHAAVAEGTASSSLPVVWNRDGVRDIYSSFQLVDNPKNAAKFIDLMRRSNVRERLLVHSRNLIINKYNKNVIAKQFVDIFTAEKQISNNTVCFEHFKKVIVVYSITNFDIFHRKEMLTALANTLHSDTYLLIVEPGSHYKTLLDKQIDTKEALDQFANANIISIGNNIGRIKALHGNFPSEVQCDEKLRKLSTLKSAISYFVSKSFKDVEIYHWLYKPEQIKHINSSQKYVYEVYDEYTMDFATGEIKEDVAQLEKEVLAKSSYTFFTSEPLFERKREYLNSKQSKVISN